ncbi:MAG: ATP-grasp domain-containing protein [Pseudomonadales bacterium]|nr:ATP-grasp domain-containing protein [Pseudomonadales bacterium]
MRGKTVLIANRGEIAVRIIRTLADLGWRSVAIYAEDDNQSLHVLKADVAVKLAGLGASAYLDIDQIIQIAQEQDCAGIHPGYGFLSENPDFAKACLAAGLTFIGPDIATLVAFGDKAQARALAMNEQVPVLEGLDYSVSLSQAKDFFSSLPKGSAMAIKAISGGGGRGLRVVNCLDDIDSAYARCRSEAQAAFGDASVYVERWAPKARHIEVQILGDGHRCLHLFDRECTLQRRHQKVIEIAPSPSIDSEYAQALYNAAMKMAQAMNYRGLATFEFLVFEQENQIQFVFIEANPRIQVEHTVTEMVLGLDLVELQLLVCFGLTIDELSERYSLKLAERPCKFSAQARINLETYSDAGELKSSSGLLTGWDVPTGSGVRIDSYVYSGYRTSPRYDSMVAKLIVHCGQPQYENVLHKLSQALQEFRIQGVKSNLGLLKALVTHERVVNNDIDTGFIDTYLQALIQSTHSSPNSLLPYNDNLSEFQQAGFKENVFKVSENDMTAPMQGVVISISVEVGDLCKKGETLMVMDSMKMEHLISAPCSGKVEAIYIQVNDTTQEGQPLLRLIATDETESLEEIIEFVDLELIRDDLQEVNQRHGFGYDENRPEAVAKRRATGQRTARENIKHLCDEDSFIEYGPLVIAAQRRRRSVEDLMEKTPGDGMVTGLGRINGGLFGEDASQCVVMTYDYTVMAGTQGIQNHHKKDRMFELAERLKTPVVLFSEGGGGRPGDTDGLGSSASLDCLAFLYFARLSGLVPLIGIASGRNFAGNAALLGCCDVVIATRNANIGMGGPAMIEGGGLGIYKPEDVGPTAIQSQNGVIDILVEDEADAVIVAQKYLSYFQGAIKQWNTDDQRILRTLIPENRLRMYDIRRVIDTLFDQASVLEIRKEFGKGMITAFARLEGKPVGVIANNPQYLAGAIDSDGADKSARFMQLCDAFDIPLVFLCDTPGIMVGPEIEKTALVRHASRIFVTAANLTIPFFTVVLRKAYGLGAMTMAGGSLKAPVFTVSWPTGEFGAMGLEGAVKLGFKTELAAAENEAQRQEIFNTMVSEMYERGKAVNTATFFEFDDVIDPAETRKWLLAGLASAKVGSAKNEGVSKKRPSVDTW